MNPELQGTKPLVVIDRTGRIVDVTSMSRKGFTKSTEQGALWFVHEETGRVLPYNENLTMISLSDEERWYRAVVDSAAAPGSGRDSAPPGTSGGPAPASGAVGGLTADAGKFLASSARS